MLEMNRKRGRTWRGDRWGLKTVGMTPLSNMLTAYRSEVVKIQYPLANVSLSSFSGWWCFFTEHMFKIKCLLVGPLTLT